MSDKKYSKIALFLNFAFHIFIKNFSLFLVPPCPYQEEGFGEYQVEIYRYQLQDGSWTFPNTQGQNGLYGTSQEGCRQDRIRCINIFLLISRKKLLIFFRENLAAFFSHLKSNCCRKYTMIIPKKEFFLFFLFQICIQNYLVQQISDLQIGKLFLKSKTNSF